VTTFDPLSVDRPTPARMYDYFLHGKDNFPIDRAAADKVIEKLGTTVTRAVVWENRHFLGRVVRYLARDCGITQFLDVGAGLPSMENTHHVAQREVPEARVVYVDYDPVVAAHGQALLSESGVGRTRFITADLRDPGAILDHPDTVELIDFARPVALLLIAVFHFIPDSDDPARIVKRFAERMVPGSYLAISHLTTDSPSAEERQLMVDTYKDTAAPMVYRSRAEIADLFDGFEFVAPGLVRPGEWHADPTQDRATERLYGAVARKR
jgi:hypothetical protein